MRRRAGREGQAAVELLVAIPLVVLAALMAWQLVAVLGAGMRAEQRVRADALRAVGATGRTVVVSAAARVPAVLPGVDGLTIRSRAAVRAP